MNVIDALFITLGLDTSEYEKKEKAVITSLKKFGETSDKQTKLIAEQGKKAAGAFSALKIEILGALAAFGMGAGFKAFIESSMNMQAAAGRQAAALGVSANSLQVWKQMAVEMGESGDAAVGTLNAVAQGMANARQGHMDWFQTAMRLGVQGLSLNDSTDTALSKINQAAYRIKEKYGGAQAVNFLGQLGIGDLAQQTLLMENPAKFAADRANAAKHSIQLTKQEIEQNQKLQKQLGDLLGDFGKLKVKIADKLEPVIIRLGKEFENWINSIDWDKAIADLGSFIDKVQSLIGALGGVKGILIEIAAIKVLGWAASIGGWVIQLRALTLALRAARAAAAAGGAAGAAAAGGAADGVGGAGLAAGAARVVTSWALPVWALFHSESTGGKRREDGTYEDEFDWNSAAAQAAIAKQKAQSQKKNAQLFSSLESRYGLPKGLLDSVYNAESSRGKNMLSPKGAMGPFQFMPGTAADYGLQGSDVFDLNKSASAAARYLHDLLNKFHGNLKEAVAAYNWGPGNVVRNGLLSIPSETSNYVQKVLAAIPSRAGSNGATTNTNSVTINGPINVQTKATNADGVAKGMSKALRSNPLINGYVTAAS